VKFSRSAAVIASLGTAALILSGCGTSVSASNGSRSAPATKVTLTYWGWAPNMAKVVAIWNKENPNIQVDFSQAGGASDLPAKLLTAGRAGNGPDVAQAEYQTLPSLVVGGIVKDITSEVTSFKGEFSPATWGSTTLGGAVYGVPQDVGPMMMFYRADLFKKYGILVPKTWAEYAAAAQKLHAAHPSVYLGTLPQDGGTVTGLVQQAGGNWWTTDGTKWKVGIDSPASTDVLSYWQKLSATGALYTQPFLTPQWNQLVASGNILTWSAGVWAPGVIDGVAAGTAGKWVAAPLPQWTPGDDQVGLMGGSSVFITKSSKHPVQAAEFLQWLNGSKQGSGDLASISNIYPASIAGQKALAAAKVPALMSAQPNFYTVAAKVAANTASVTWGPDVQTAFDAFSDQLQAAQASRGSFAGALKTVQSLTVADMTKTGFTVEN
jgi:multiple sugar transport system substrate-binding protein